MDLHRLIAGLSEPGAYPHAVEAVEVHQTHISVVFVAGDFAYKIKKPLALSFLDYATLDARRRCCDEELRLNRRLAPEVYLGVVPVTDEGGTLRIDGRGEAVEWAVKMRRLPAEATFASLVRDDRLSPDRLRTLAARLAAFHRDAEAGESISDCGSFASVAENARDNFRQSEAFVGEAVSRAVFDRFRDLTEQALAEHRPLIEARAGRGVVCDGHGDLRLEHIYVHPDRPESDDLLVVDCVEFNERLRCADPVSDAAFLVMDLAAEGRRDLGAVLADAYFAASGDEEGRALLPFYVSYRAAVRGKVGAIKAREAEVAEEERRRALAKARAHWLVGLGALESPARAPALLLVAGLPGTGKSTLARALADRAGFAVIRSDEVRKELIGKRDADLYSRESSERTYAECLRRAGALLFEGRRVLIDANFRLDLQRRAALDAARSWGVPALLLVCRADPETIRRRLAARRGDASDADWPVYQKLAAEWQPFSPAVARAAREIDADGPPEAVLSAALGTLETAGLGSSNG